MRFPLAAAAIVAALSASALAEVAVGDAAPDFTLKDQEGKEVVLSSFRGRKNVVVAFYPKDFTAGCTNEMKCLQRENKRIQARDTVVLAISADPVESHAKFATTLGVQFRLLADTDLAVARQYGVFTASAGGAYAARSAFVVDKEGKVRWLERSLIAPVGTLEGTELWNQIEKLGGRVDPVAALAELPEPERGGKTVLARFVDAFLREDMTAVEALVAGEAFGRPGEAAQMQRDRRKGAMDRLRGVVDKADLSSLKFNEVLDLATSRVFTKEAATPTGLVAFGASIRDLASRLAEGELLVVGRTSAPKLGDVQVLPKEFGLRLAKRGEEWKVLEFTN